MDADPVRILLIDGHRMFRQGLSLLINLTGTLSVVGEAGDGKTAVRLLESVSPEVVISDIRLPDCNGIELAVRLRAKLPTLKIIFVAASSDFKLVRLALDSGASGYLLKTSMPSDLIQGIEAARQGGIPLSPSVAADLVDDYQQRGRSPPEPAPLLAAPLLSERETEVLRHIAQGSRNKEIADHLNLSVKTVETYRRRLVVKLNCSSVAGLVRYALRTGVITN